MADNSSAATCSLLHSIFSDDDSQDNSSAAVANTSFSSERSVVDRLKFIITLVIIPVFCGFGVVGNVMTIVIMSQRRITTAMSCRIKRASRAGLIGLAVADLLCCIVTLAITYGRDDDIAAYSERQQVKVLTLVYGPFVQNACAKSNTWLTVVVAVGRYMVICRPLHARYLVSVMATRLAIIAAFILAALVELPTLWTFTVVTLVCPTLDGQSTSRYFVMAHGLLTADSRLKMAYDILSISLGFLVPVGVLVFCNCCLIFSLKQSNHMARLYIKSPVEHQDFSTSGTVIYSSRQFYIRNAVLLQKNPVSRKTVRQSYPRES